MSILGRTSTTSLLLGWMSCTQIIMEAWHHVTLETRFSTGFDCGSVGSRMRPGVSTKIMLANCLCSYCKTIGSSANVSQNVKRQNYSLKDTLFLARIWAGRSSTGTSTSRSNSLRRTSRLSTHFGLAQAWLLTMLTCRGRLVSAEGSLKSVVQLYEYTQYWNSVQEAPPTERICHVP